MSPTTLLADIWDDAAPFLIGFGLVVVIPLIAILTAHQRRMAEIIHKNQGQGDRDSEVIARLEAMQREIAELRQRQNEAILAIEDKRTSQSVQHRIGE